MGLLELIVAHTFFRNALLAGLLASVGCGVMGAYVVVKRLSLLAGGIAHAVLGGMGIAYYFGLDPLLGAVVSAVCAALLIGWIHLRWRESEDTVIAALWSAGMAVGIIFISQTPGYNTDLMSYLFGNILMVPDYQLLWMAALDTVVLVAVFSLYKTFLAVCFDEEFARLRGVPVERYYLFLLVLVALTVVLLIQVVGLILVIALLTLPAATAALYAQSLRSIMIHAMIAGALLCTTGLVCAYYLDWPAGPTMVLCLTAVYLLTVTILRRVRKST